MGLFIKPEDAEDGLTKLLLKAVPENQYGNKTLSHLADLIGVSRWGMRKWINQQKIPPERVTKIVEIGKTDSDGNYNPKARGRVNFANFHEYVYKT